MNRCRLSRTKHIRFCLQYDREAACVTCSTNHKFVEYLSWRETSSLQIMAVQDKELYSDQTAEVVVESFSSDEASRQMTSEANLVA
jgi:hypothetical protein